MKSSIAFYGLISIAAAQRSSLAVDIDRTSSRISLGNVEPTATQTVSGPIQTGSACARIAELVTKSDSQVPSVQAELAYACLKSVPIVSNDAALTIDAIKQMAEFQSTITYLKDPPKGWPNEAVDIMAGLDDIKSKINSGGYSNEYDFEVDIASLLTKAHDGHLAWSGMAFSGAFRWRRNSNIALLSASQGGSGVPKVWAVRDFNTTNASYEPSAISQINGKDVVQFLQEESKLNAFHDPDARYNAMFLMQPAENYGYFTNPRFYPGPTTNVTYDNGTSNTYRNAAIVTQPSAWSYISDPDSFYETYIVPETSSQRVKKRDPNLLPMHLEHPRDYEIRGDSVVQHGSVPVSYPKPFVSHTEKLVPLAGYFNQVGGDDIGVLVVQTFNTLDAAGTLEFQQVVEDYISEAKSRGVAKHIIDIRSNGGGKVLLGYDTYLQFFPSQAPQTQSRYRGSPASTLIGESISSFTDMTVLNADAFISPFSNDVWLDTNLSALTTWDAMYPPESFHNDNFTTLLKYNLSDPIVTSNTRLGVGITMTGYNSRANFTTDPFRAEDIVILSDGICASTCSIFIELMAQQSHVRTLAVGGRPQLGPMVPVGGTKGTLVLPALYLQAITTYMLETFATTRSQAVEWAKFLPGEFPLAVVDASVNFQDNIRAGLESGGVPTQFLNDTASCRIWYEPRMYVNVTRVWERTAEVAFGKDGALDEAACVQGSVSSREQQTGVGEGNPTAGGGAKGGEDKKDAAGVVRPAGAVVLGWCAVVVVGSWMM